METNLVAAHDRLAGRLDDGEHRHADRGRLPVRDRGHEPKADRWRSLPAAPQPKEFIEPQKWTPSLAWTGGEVALQQPFTDEFAAFDVDRGRWRLLPSTGGGRDMTGPLLATASGLVRTFGSLDGVTSVYLLRPGAGKWRRLPDLPPQLHRTVSAGSFIFVGGLMAGSNDHDRGRYLLPQGRWEPLPPAPVWTAVGASVADGGLVALWYGSATERPERPNGALLRPKSDLWEAIPPPPERVHGGLLVPGGRTSSWSCRNPTPLTPDWQAAFTRDRRLSRTARRCLRTRARASARRRR